MREITIPALVTTLRRGVWLLLTVVVLSLLVTVVALKLQRPLYTATMVVAPAQTDLTAASQLASELEEFASLATLAQTPAKIERVSDLERYVQLFGSTALAARLQAEDGMLQIAFRDEWDAERQAWRPPHGVLARLERAALRFFGYPAWTEPDVVRLAEWLRGSVDVGRIGISSLFRIQMSYPDRAVAILVIEAVHRTADRLLREESLGRVDGQIAQVESELAQATFPIRQEALKETLVGQYQVQALLRADQPYAAQIVVPATASSSPSSPNPLLVLALAGFSGVVLGVFLVFLRDALRSGGP